MPRFFFEISYDGSHFHGWQRQNNAISVQQKIEEVFSMIYRENVEILGSGRTDKGVHASSFFFHVDLPHCNDNVVFRANSILPKSIAVHRFQEVGNEAHARFDAIKRGYIYYAHSHKSPFLLSYSSRIVELKNISADQLNETAKLLLKYNEFTPFCKAHADNKTMKCKLTLCEWTYNEESKQYILRVESDRFLRGMIRLIVGMSLQVARGKMDIEYVKKQLSTQQRLEKALSAPAHGLYLCDIKYPYI
jgi:tRNA pseudouridine38-40 synthase